MGNYNICRELQDRYRLKILKYNITGKGKSIPLQVWTGPESSRRLSLPVY
jgi:hypothetical protein